MIVLVVSMHAAVTYSHLCGWYFMQDPRPGLALTAVFATYQTFLQAFFMGLLFLIAGYFVPGAFHGKVSGGSCATGLCGWGVPSLLFMLFIQPFKVYRLLRSPNHIQEIIVRLSGLVAKSVKVGKFFDCDRVGHLQVEHEIVRRLVGTKCRIGRAAANLRFSARSSVMLLSWRHAPRNGSDKRSHENRGTEMCRCRSLRSNRSLASYLRYLSRSQRERRR
jgi:hypothetical protein